MILTPFWQFLTYLYSKSMFNFKQPFTWEICLLNIFLEYIMIFVSICIYNTNFMRIRYLFLTVYIGCETLTFNWSKGANMRRVLPLKATSPFFSQTIVSRENNMVQYGTELCNHISYNCSILTNVCPDLSKS